MNPWLTLTLTLLLAGCGAATPRPTPEEALLDEARAALQRGDDAKAREIWQPLAEADNGEAQNNLGLLYDQRQDYATARQWYDTRSVPAFQA